MKKITPILLGLLLSYTSYSQILAENFDDIDWVFFNTTGIPDSTVPVSKTRYDYKEYKYFVGKNSVGAGTELAEFVSFAIKIVLQGTNSSLPPMVKDFRALAFQA